ncbi:lysosome-associated membrane glycoprotein 1 [Rhinatrema bivittatum]|uniref:lysosome-associated membrane glycoprotein 1 n=1 Tax=Rhinatrema bivittatum TaxID=194408 RepID=UPI0011280BEF|nr:lysosome-associated membrane glycoprotein 1 [Rhinatrema bivittatum]
MVTPGERRLFLTAAFPLLLWLLLLAYVQIAASVQFDVRDDTNKSCILADLAVNFSVVYSVGSNKTKTAHFELPANTSLLSSSSCGKGDTASLLAVGFGIGHNMSLNFTNTSSKYQVDELTFTYNLSDAAIFTDSAETGLKVVVSKNTGIEADLNTTYKCTNDNNIHMGAVNAIFHNIRIEAYPSNNTFSVKETACSQDVTPTTVPTTTSAPPSPPPPPPVPESGSYQMNNTNGTCILTVMGLQLNITYLSTANKTKVLLFNVVPKNVTVSGNCSAPSPVLTLGFENTLLTFIFAKNETSKTFYLGGVAINTTLPSDANVTTYEAKNTSISYLETSLGKSYMCKTKQELKITDTFSINAFNLRVQAFKFDNNKFGAAEECQLDEDSILVPIIVGAALAGLVLIVLIAYLIGRKRSHAGYQTI